MLKQELEGFVLSDSLDVITDIELERMELLAERVAKREEERMRSRRREQERQQRKQQKQRRYQSEFVMEPERQAAVVATEIVDSRPVNRGAAKDAQWQGGMFTEVEVVSSQNFGQEGQEQYHPTTPSGSDSKVEVLSNLEYAEYEQQFKSAQGVFDASAEGGYDADNIEGKMENPAADFVLRALDVISFIGEKFFLVLLPDLITGGQRITSRYARASNRGRGSVGWKPLKNAKIKNIR